MFIKKHIRQLVLILLDVIAMLVSLLFAYWFRFEMNVLFNPKLTTYLDQLKAIIIIYILLKLLILFLSKMYSSLWHYASLEEFVKIIIASFIANAIAGIGVMLIAGRLPLSIYIMVYFIDTTLFSSIRISYRVFRALRQRTDYGEFKIKRTMVIGSGQAGVMTIKELKKHKELMMKPILAVDDDPSKIGQSISGVPVEGPRTKIVEYVRKYQIDTVIIAIPSVERTIVRETFTTLKDADVEVEIKVLPGFYEIIGGKVGISSLRNVEIIDLLGRKEIELNHDEFKDYISGRTIMVTGGAGSIGSELCRQLAKLAPSKIVIIEINENESYLFQLELRRTFPELTVEVIIASVRDRDYIFELVSKIKPHVIFHAAAHKHVPLMEKSPTEAIKNNVFGTLNVMDAAAEYDVERFVLISTDKAVNPMNVMGASKRIAEMLIQSRRNYNGTKYVAVRFGNVLGSNGSVIPIFKKQIRSGGPVLVTHPDIERYFMTIPEASKLVIQASKNANSGDIFILDMGEPVKILSLAENLISLSGLKPYKDIDIQFSGLRPGEKMYEELILDKVKSEKTKNDKIFIEKPECFSSEQIDVMLADLKDACLKGQVRNVLKCYIPTFQMKK